MGKNVTKKKLYVVVGSNVTMQIYLKPPSFKGEMYVTKIQQVPTFWCKKLPMALKFGPTIKNFKITFKIFKKIMIFQKSSGE